MGDEDDAAGDRAVGSAGVARLDVVGGGTTHLGGYASGLLVYTDC
jgi:hypothetical protein